MSICDPRSNVGMPPWVGPIGSKLTPAMRAEAVRIMNDISLPVGYNESKWVDGVPVYLVCQCHTLSNGVVGIYHAGEVWLITDPAHFPPRDGPLPSPEPDPIEARKTDWPLVAVCGVALVTTCGLFGLALHFAGNASKRARA